MATSKSSVFSKIVIAFISSLTALTLLFLVFLILGEERERRLWTLAPSTLSLYTTPLNCLHGPGPHIINCGHCGACSNPSDISSYKKTAATLTATMTRCAILGLLHPHNHHAATLHCLLSATSLTPDCANCWVANAACSSRKCLATCLKHRVLPALPSLTPWGDERLDPCHACDERFCGPEFVDCAGANRRRVGIVSDIERDEGTEICRRVDWDYIMEVDREGDQSEEDAGEAGSAAVDVAGDNEL